MSAPLTEAPATPEVMRLRLALAGSGELPRPVAHIELPLNVGRFLKPEMLARLKPSAVLIPVLMSARPSLLLTRRSEHMRNHAGQISFPGGRRDEDDASFAATALREAHEEVGLRPEAVEVIGYLDDYPTVTGYRITPVVGLVHTAFAPVFDGAEVAEIIELPLVEVLGERNRFERKLISRGGLNLPILELNHGAHRIWGATAGILWNLREKVYGDDGWPA